MTNSDILLINLLTEFILKNTPENEDQILSFIQTIMDQYPIDSLEVKHESFLRKMQKTK